MIIIVAVLYLEIKYNLCPTTSPNLPPWMLIFFYYLSLFNNFSNFSDISCF